VFKDRIPAEDAEVVRRLKAAGAVVLGKTNMHEFAFGGSSIVSYFGPVHSPWELSHIAGGSSGGSAAAVAAELCYGALGSDTAGSIRIPASHCGIVGLKPTYGLVSTRGVIPLSWSLDHVGPMTRTVADTALMLQVIAGYDPQDITSEEIKVSDYAQALGANVSSMRIGVPREFFFADLDLDIEAAMKGALSVLGRLTAGIRDVALKANRMEALRVVVRASLPLEPGIQERRFPKTGSSRPSRGRKRSHVQAGLPSHTSAHGPCSTVVPNTRQGPVRRFPDARSRSFEPKKKQMDGQRY
jgi:Asp-tRNA(Asn)/Glu-tRNA(Gln) amidotransferase A subunit family amidase